MFVWTINTASEVCHLLLVECMSESIVISDSDYGKVEGIADPPATSQIFTHLNNEAFDKYS